MQILTGIISRVRAILPARKKRWPKKQTQLVGLLKADHDADKKLFAQTEKLDQREREKKVDLFKKINAALEVSATLEEEIFYP